MESPNPKFPLYGGTSECARTNMLLLLLSEISTGAVSLCNLRIFVTISNLLFGFFPAFYNTPNFKTHKKIVF